MEKKLVSVIVPVYNVENYLKKCINSIINQTYKNLEIILVDDGSTDKSGKICDEYKLKDKRIKVIHKDNGGLSDARNFGLDVATGEYITFVDSDDFINSKMIEDFYNAIIKFNCDIVFGKTKNYSNYEQREESLKRCIDSAILKTKEECLKNININIYNTAYPKLYKSFIFKNLRFPKGINYEDSYIAPYVYELINNVVILPYNYYYRYIRENSIVHSKFSKKDYDLLIVGEERIRFYKERNNIDNIILAYKFFMSNVINLYIKAYKANAPKEEKNDMLDRYKTVYNISKSLFNIKDKLKYKSFICFPDLIAKVYVLRGV